MSSYNKKKKNVTNKTKTKIVTPVDVDLRLDDLW